MPIFYFDMIDGQIDRDEDGLELHTAFDVERELRHRLSQMIMLGDNPLRAIVKVRDEDDDMVATATISATIHLADTHH